MAKQQEDKSEALNVNVLHQWMVDNLYHVNINLSKTVASSPL
jgi:hypothetical protein